jgi:amino acid transporter
MSVREGRQPAAVSTTSAEDHAEGRRMSFYDLLFLAAGGVIGSGWLFGGTDQNAGSWAVFSWLIGGALMLVIAAVMVELSAMAPKTGGLIFLPLQSSGPLLATVVAAGLWISWALVPASEATAMVRGIVQTARWQGLVNPHGDGLTWRGIGLAAVLMLIITAVNLLGPRAFRYINNLLTSFKIAVPVLIVSLLIYAKVHPPGPVSPAFLGHPGPAVRYDLGSVLRAVTASGVIYAYIGFQGPLDFAGNVKRRGMGEAARLRWAVYGTVLGSILLYTALQVVLVYLRHLTRGPVDGTTSPYLEFVRIVAPAWSVGALNWLISVDMVLSPAGAALVFTYVLTREVAALSRAHLTHRGLQKTSRSVLQIPGGRPGHRRGGRLDVYWLILLVDFALSGFSLVCLGGRWDVLSELGATLALLVYAMPSMVLAALRCKNPESVHISQSRWHRALPATAFVASASIFYLGGWDQLWPVMTALTLGCIVLFGLPVVAAGARWYDAKACADQFRTLNKSPSAGSAIVMFGFFAVITLASLLNKYAWPTHPGYQMASAIPVIVLALVAFRWMVKLSVDYMTDNPPMLSPPSRVADKVPPRSR